MTDLGKFGALKIKSSLSRIAGRAWKNQRFISLLRIFGSWRLWSSGKRRCLALSRRKKTEEVSKCKASIDLFHKIAFSVRGLLDKHFVKTCPSNPTLARIRASPLYHTEGDSS